MPKVKDIVNIMQLIAPNSYIYQYDNVGLMVGDMEQTVSKTLCCLDVTDKVLDEAINLGCELIISHHPFIFSPISCISTNNSLGKKIIKAVKNGISIYSAHTNLDFVKSGLNDYLAKLINLNSIMPLDPYISEQEGFGRVGNLEDALTVSDLKDKLKNLLCDDKVCIIGNPQAYTCRVAVINGAGGSDTAYIDMAIKAGATALVTGEVKHHVAIYACENNFNIIEVQHYTSERVYIFELVKILRERAKINNINIEVLLSIKDENPRL